MELSPRQERILLSVVEAYNESGEPVGSKHLLELLPDNVSSATVRNEMARLEDMGYLEQPHTSAGRIPSPRGYRKYLDHILPGGELPAPVAKSLEAELLARVGEPENWMTNTAKLLNEITGCAVMRIAQNTGAAHILALEAVVMGETLLLLVLQTDKGSRQSRLLRLEEALSESQMERLSQLLGSEFRGKAVEFCTVGEIQSIAAKCGDPALMPILLAIAEMAATIENTAYLTANHAPAALRALEHRNTKLLPDKSLSQGIHVILGEELDEAEASLHNSAVILTPLQAPLAAAPEPSLLALVGGMRRNYKLQLPQIRLAAKLLNELLSLSKKR
ncbi:MAG: hypothetical protein LBR73_02520 [Oscillospiraceae bacterium]|jgi:heat-inducible transcriptional repressor|nr:hypothetical protein [Oscillospiraceae bacterium]